MKLSSVINIVYIYVKKNNHFHDSYLLLFLNFMIIEILNKRKHYLIRVNITVFQIFTNEFKRNIIAKASRPKSSN